MEKDNSQLREKLKIFMEVLDEKQRRILLAAEAKSLGYGGIQLISGITGVSRRTISKGIKEIGSNDSNIFDTSRSRKKGGGRKPIEQTQPGIKEAIEQMLEGYTKGDPETPLIWTSKSLRNIEAGLKEKGFTADHATITRLLKELGYSLQSNRKQLAIKPSHPDRNAQFEYINKMTKLYFIKGIPVLSIDAKKKENIGNFKNNGKEYRKKGEPIEVLDHDFPIAELGKATPYGVYDIFKNHGFVNVGLSSDTAEFAVESLRKWQSIVGSKHYPDAKEIMITADCGGSNGNRTRLWKTQLQELANELKKKITVLHFPPGTSKWNKIEHRLFSFISKNWRGQPLISEAVILDLIASTKTETGLTVECVIDKNTYPRGIKVEDEVFEVINIKPHKFHGDWNYTISPQKKSKNKK